ncbi:Hypothetical Protein FCC1311_112922 [Hondaea fermentalgiana]|uniref:Uncharacterized protein n=1 Tax=Hondaea fermentalgiana TaxID=2315210 RepID=A0A2R5GXL8_9STRA|nr:Hypothetical Protein FCC1311_112922 [Hondaea fermentalgiana]|eukprot:GBG35069.1 Hypothetical Protein FCC1311_112922 [Hondaea fermentalgiana]
MSGLASQKHFRSFCCVWLLQVTDALDSSLVSPSMSAYITSMGGTRSTYGYAVALLAVGNIVGLPVWGILADQVSFAIAFRGSLIFGIVGAALYSLAGLVGALWMIPLSRFVLGISTGVISANMAFAGAAAQGQQSKVSGVTVLVYNVTTVVAPALGSLLTILPQKGTALSSFTYCGYLLMLFNVFSLTINLMYFTEPEREEASVEEAEAGHVQEDGAIASEENSLEESLLPSPDRPAPQPKSIPGKVCAGVGMFFQELKSMVCVLKETGAWVSFVTSSQNAFNQMVVLWGLPIVTEDYFGWGQRRNGFLLMGTSLVGIMCLPIVLRNLDHWSDRCVFVSFQQFVGLSLLLFTTFAGCTHHVLTPVLLCFILGCWGFGTFGQVPGNMGLFSKLLGKRKQGKFQAVLFMVMNFSRSMAGLLIGASDGPGGTCYMFATALGLWALQFAAYLPMFKNFHPDLLAGSAPATRVNPDNAN